MDWHSSDAKVLDWCLINVDPRVFTIWERWGSTLAQVMASCLMAPSHYLNQFDLLSVQWNSPENNFTRDPSAINHQICLKVSYLNLHSNLLIWNLPIQCPCTICYHQQNWCINIPTRHWYVFDPSSQTKSSISVIHYAGSRILDKENNNMVLGRLTLE